MSGCVTSGGDNQIRKKKDASHKHDAVIAGSIKPAVLTMDAGAGAQSVEPSAYRLLRTPGGYRQVTFALEMLYSFASFNHTTYTAPLMRFSIAIHRHSVTGRHCRDRKGGGLSNAVAVTAVYAENIAPAPLRCGRASCRRLSHRAITAIRWQETHLTGQFHSCLSVR